MDTCGFADESWGHEKNFITYSLDVVAPRVRSVLPISIDWSAASYPGALCPVMRFLSLFPPPLPNPTPQSAQLSQDEHKCSTRNSVSTPPSRIRATQWSRNRMDATPLGKHFNPLRKLREVLMTCRRGSRMSRNEWEMRFTLNKPRSPSLTCDSLWGIIRKRRNTVFKVRGAFLQHTPSQNVTVKWWW